jgi:hypothetical protein
VVRALGVKEGFGALKREERAYTRDVSKDAERMPNLGRFVRELGVRQLCYLGSSPGGLPAPEEGERFGRCVGVIFEAVRAVGESSVGKMRTALGHLRAFLVARRGGAWDGDLSDATAEELAGFVEEESRTAFEAARNTLAKRKRIEEFEMAQAMGLTPPGERPNDGSSVATQRREALVQCCDFGFDFREQIAHPAFKAAQVVRRRVAQPSATTTPWMLCAMEAVAADSGQGALTRYYAGAEVFQCLSGGRFEQMQDLQLHGVFKRGESERPMLAFTMFAQKNPRPKKTRPQTALAPVRGVLGGTRWFEEGLWPALQEHAAAGALWLDNDSPDGDPWKATRLLPRPMSGDRATVAKRAIYVRLCGVAPEAAMAFGVDSARHVPAQAETARGVPGDEQPCLGGWTGCALRDKDLMPEVRVAALSGRKWAVLPHMYASSARVAVVADRFENFMDGLRDYVAAFGVEAIPQREGAWVHFEERCERDPRATPCPGPYVPWGARQ